jgi:hormone-sensitive lipase
MGYRRPDGLILFYPAVNLNKDVFTTSYMLSLEDLIVPHTYLKLCLEAYLQDQTKYADSNPYISPIIADDAVLAEFSHTRIIVGSADPLHDDCFRFAERLMNNGVDVQLKVYSHFTHGFLNFDLLGGVKQVRIPIR